MGALSKLGRYGVELGRTIMGLAWEFQVWGCVREGLQVEGSGGWALAFRGLGFRGLGLSFQVD